MAATGPGPAEMVPPGLAAARIRAAEVARAIAPDRAAAVAVQAGPD